MGKTFNKGLDKVDRKEGLFKSLKNIEDKNEDQLELLVKLTKPLGLQKMKVIITTTIMNLLSTSFTET